MGKVANEHVRDMWKRYTDGRMSADFKRSFREMYRDSFSDELKTTASHWLKVQKANHIACWPFKGRTRAWNPLHCHTTNVIFQ